ncbi:TPA: hypothetical protein QIX85_000307 [Serratia marcescens]|nr:hypothetical protein [Serratia marcescens]
MKSLGFVHSGVAGQAEVTGSSVFVRYAGAGFHLSAAKDGLRQKIISELAKAGLMPKFLK